MDPKRIVKAGYESIADAYTRERDESSDDVRLLDDFASRLADGGRVLDAGCGGGKPVARTLSERLRVVGLDLAAAQLRLLRSTADSARPVRGDMVRLPFRDGSFDGVVSFYAIIHVPREEHASLLREFYRVLRPSGVALLCMGELDLPGEVEEYVGTRMFWSHYDGPRNRAMLRECGFDVVSDRAVADFQNPDAAHRFFLATRP